MKNLNLSIILLLFIITSANAQRINGLYGLKIDSGARIVKCRTVPFLACPSGKRGHGTRKIINGEEKIPIGTSSNILFFSGMINGWYDGGVAHWAGHPEINEKRDDQVFIGTQIGSLKIVYDNEQVDEIPLIMGATAWWDAQWAFGPTHDYPYPVREPFISIPSYAKLLSESLLLKESTEQATNENTFNHFYLTVKPRDEIIKEIIITDNTEKWGYPLISGVTLLNPGVKQNLFNFGEHDIDTSDMAIKYDVRKKYDFSSNIHALSNALYTRESDLPRSPDNLKLPLSLNSTEIHFSGNPVNGILYAQMLNNIWVENLVMIDSKMDKRTGFMQETCADCPWYGGYSGIGTWVNHGIYYDQSYARTSDHLATLAFRNLYDRERYASFIDFADKWLYYFRSNHDISKGPANPELDTTMYPKDAPPHWSMTIANPVGFPVINELPGDEETDGHGCTMIGRWFAWRMNGAPVDSWLTQPRKQVYNTSRWQSTADAADFVCWLMDYTGQDVIWCEGEVNCWSANGSLIPGMSSTETDLVKIRESYAKADMYELYPSFACMIGLECSAQIADALGKTSEAKKWRGYAGRIEKQLIPRLTFDTPEGKIWRVCKKSVWPAYMESLCEAYLSIYKEGIDMSGWNTEFAQITRNTFRVRIAQPPQYAQVLGMGYGQGWLTHSALVLDEMDAAGKCLINIAKYSYDKNMDRDFWRRWLWLIPEGTNILPDGSWYRIGDLTNGANQGPCMHAIELCAGLDDLHPGKIKILPRVPEPFTGIEVKNLFICVPEGREIKIAKVNYQYQRNIKIELSSDIALPDLSIRVGPFASQSEVGQAMNKAKLSAKGTMRTVSSGTFKKQPAWWLWIEGMKNVKDFKASF